MKRAGQWMLRAGFSILDQGLVSLSNFGLSIVLARILPAAEYGAFAVDFNIFLVIAGFHNALLIEPMSVLGPARHADTLDGYLRSVVWVHLALTGVLAAVGLVTSVVLRHTPLGPALLSMSLGLPVILLFWLLRRAHYLETKPGLAASSSAVYFVALTVSTGILWWVGRLSAASGFWAMAFAGLVASFFSFRRLGIRFRFGMDAARASTGTVRENWDFGRWLLPSVLLFPLLSQIQLFMTGAYLGLGPAGILRALQNPTLPVMQVVTALSTLAIPVLSREFTTRQSGALYRRGMMYMGAMTAIALAYEAVILLTGNLWDRVLYGGRYSSYDWLMPVLGLMPIASAIATGCSVILRAVQRPALTTVTHVFGGVFGAASTYFLIQHWRLPGAVYGLVVAQAVTAVVSLILVFGVQSGHAKPNHLTVAAAAE